MRCQAYPDGRQCTGSATVKVAFQLADLVVMIVLCKRHGEG